LVIYNLTILGFGETIIDNNNISPMIPWVLELRDNKSPMV